MGVACPDAMQRGAMSLCATNFWRRLSSQHPPDQSALGRATSSARLRQIIPANVPVPRQSVMNINMTPREAQPSAWDGIVCDIREARQAVKVAAGDDSDDFERDQSVALARNAIRRYDAQHASLQSLGEDAKASLACLEAEVGEEIHKLKHELFQSRKPRVWMMTQNWF